MEEERLKPGYGSEDELDLYDIYRTIRKRAGLILGIFVASFMLAAVASFLMTPVYRSSFTARVPVIASQESVITPEETVIAPGEGEMLIEELNELVEEGRHDELAERLGVKEARGVVSFGADVEGGKKNYLEITMEVNDPMLIPGFKEGTVKFLNRNDYVKERLELRRESLTHLREEVASALNEVEGLKNMVREQIREGKLKDIGFNPAGLETVAIELRQKLKDLERDLKLLRGFEVTVEPVVPEKPVEPNRGLNVAVAAVISLFFGMFLAFLLEWAERQKRNSA